MSGSNETLSVNLQHKKDVLNLASNNCNVLKLRTRRFEVKIQCTPSVGRRKRRRPKEIWRNTVIAELDEMALSWGES